MIPITVVKVGEEEEALVRQVLRSGMLAQGSMVQQFEQHCCEMTGAQHAVAVNNGTTALVVALEALQLQPGDEVVTSPFTFVATLNAILEAGATLIRTPSPLRSPSARECCCPYTSTAKQQR